jgi:hypothetical protein
MRGSNFFDVPALSRAGQSLGVYAGKFIHAWPLIIRKLPRLIMRFRPGARG